MSSLGERIRTIRRYFNLTQREFGMKLNKTMAMIQRWEAGTAIPHDNNMVILEQAFDINPKWLRYGDGDMLLPKIDGDVDHVEILCIDAMYLDKVKRNALQLAREVTMTYYLFPKHFLPDGDTSNIICSQINIFKPEIQKNLKPLTENITPENSTVRPFNYNLKTACSEIKSGSYVFIDISHDLTQMDTDTEELKDSSYYLAGWARGGGVAIPRSVIHGVSDKLIIVKRSDLTELDFVVGKVVGSYTKLF